MQSMLAYYIKLNSHSGIGDVNNNKIGSNLIPVDTVYKNQNDNVKKKK